MTIKEEMSPKRDKVEKRADEVKIKSLQKKIEKQDRCIRDKDKRIRKIEDYFKFRNRSIATIILTVLCCIPFALIALYLFPLPINMNQSYQDYILHSSIVVGFGLPAIVWFIFMIIIWSED